MGLKLTEFFEPVSYEEKDTEIIICNECLAHLCLSSLVISDQFWGLSGDAYLVDRLINIQCDQKEKETSMRTGRYVIDHIKCLQCLTKLGWQYKKSYKYSEYYKEGKFVIEKKFIRQIANHSSTALLTEQAKVLKRRRSSASITSNATDEDVCISSLRKRLESDHHQYSESIPLKGCIHRNSVTHFRDGLANLLSRGPHSHGKAEHDEDEDTPSSSIGF